jgi:hypothetical protein
MWGHLSVIRKHERDVVINVLGSWEMLRAGFIERARVQSGRVKDLSTWITSIGFEACAADRGLAVSHDGREVLWVGDVAYALRPDIHTSRLEQALADAKGQREDGETKSVVGTELLSAMVCPKCGDMLQHTAVCPACAAGKLGYRHRYTCVCGGVDFVSKEAL